MKVYMLAFERHPLGDYAPLLARIKSVPEVTNWWHYLAACYLLVSPVDDATTLCHIIRDALEDSRFLLAEVDLRNSNGWLPRRAWDWIHRHRDDSDDPSSGNIH